MEPDRKVRVVIVDDHDDLRLLIRLLLEADDRFELVGEGSDGAEGLTVVEAEEPDLVLIDLAMPGVDGLELLDACHGRWPNLPIVAVLSGFNRSVMGPVTAEHGAVAYIEKGVTLGSRVLDELWDIWIEHGVHRLAGSA